MVGSCNPRDGRTTGLDCVVSCSRFQSHVVIKRANEEGYINSGRLNQRPRNLRGFFLAHKRITIGDDCIHRPESQEDFFRHTKAGDCIIGWKAGKTISKTQQNNCNTLCPFRTRTTKQSRFAVALYRPIAALSSSLPKLTVCKSVQ
jgi:hypothetical protein